MEGKSIAESTGFGLYDLLEPPSAPEIMVAGCTTKKGRKAPQTSWWLWGTGHGHIFQAKLQGIGCTRKKWPWPGTEDRHL